MFDSQELQVELVKAILSLVVGMLILAAGWFVGNNLSLQWSLRQKKRELELASLNKLYELYGEFFAIWKLWNVNEDDSRVFAPLQDNQQWSLLERACSVEGQVQAFLMKLMAERPLDSEQLAMLGKFRQAFQILREHIQDNKPLKWGSSVPGECKEYATFKTLTYHVACLLFDSPAILTRDSKPDALVVLQVTSNLWENTWIDETTVNELDKKYKTWRKDAARKNGSA